MKNIRYHFVILILSLLTLCNTSCINTRNVIYFNNLSDSTRIALDSIKPSEFLIQTNDEISVSVGGESEKTVQYVNQYLGTSAGGSMNAIVDIHGEIELPKIGKVKVMGLTKEQAKDTITQAYREYLIDPIVSLKFGNFRFSVLGEVKAPGAYLVPRESVNVLEALAQAGDLTQFAERTRLRIIRDVNGKREIISLNLNDKSILNSPDYYLYRNDIIYAEPKDIKTTTENFQRTITYTAGITSMLAIFLIIFRK